MRKSLKVIVGAVVGAALASPIALEPALAAGGDFGPNTCLNGFVWREAFNGDVVCVTPSTRSKAAADNAAAPSRRVNGDFGPNTCIQGFVWREARTGDVVCVTVPTRSQTAADNAAAASRRNSLNMTLSSYTTANTTTCDGDTCTSQNDSTTRHRVVVTNINVGKALLGLYRSSDRRRLKSWTVTSSPAAGRPGGRVAFRTSALVCNGAPNAYFRIQDPTSGRWSARQYVNTGCVAF